MHAIWIDGILLFWSQTEIKYIGGYYQKKNNIEESIAPLEGAIALPVRTGNFYCLSIAVGRKEINDKNESIN